MSVVLLKGEPIKIERLDLDLSNKFRLFFDLCLRHGKYILAVADSLTLSVFLALALNGFTPTHFISVAFLITVWASLAFFKHTYASVLTEDAEIIVRRIFYHWVTFMAASWILYPILFQTIYTYKNYLLGLLYVGIAAFATRVLFLSVRKKYKYLLIKKRKIAIIGDNSYSKQLTQNIRERCSEYQIERCFDKGDISLVATDHEHPSDIFLMAQNGIREIFCCISSLNSNQIQQLLNEADKYMIRVRFLPDNLSFTDRIKIDTINKVPVFILRPEPLLSDKNKLVKRVFDICFSLLVLVFILSWLTPILWLIIRLESKGPLFFKQKRTGLDNHNFYCYKFRSMVAENPVADSMQASKNDGRLTKVGAFLRRTSIDELPQFFNVLAGNMSVVGPRPHMLFHTDQYRKKIGAYMIRHYVKPGITGLAQINGYRGPTKELVDMQHRVEFDIDYVENWNFMLDMKIIFLTVWNLIHYDENAC